MKNLFVYISLFLTLSAAAQNKVETKTIAGSYTLAKQKVNKILRPAGAYKTRVEISNHKIKLYTDCNSVSFSYQMQKSNITVTDKVITEMVCRDATQEMVEVFSQNMARVNSYKKDNKFLYLMNKKEILIVLKIIND